MPASAYYCQVLPGFFKSNLPVLRGHKLDQVGIAAALERRQVADIEAGTFDSINGKCRNVASLPTDERMGGNIGHAVAVGTNTAVSVMTERPLVLIKNRPAGKVW